MRQRWLPAIIFGEPLADTVVPRAARRTSRFEGMVHHLGIALGGRPAASLARRLMLPVSRDTLLRVVRRHASPIGAGPVTELRRIVDLRPDREPATIEAWLAVHPEITIVSRDRGGGDAQAATNAAP